MTEGDQDVGELILNYLSLASDMQEHEKRLPWYSITEVFFSCMEINKISFQFPVLKQAPKQREEFAWDYAGRDWYYWLNTFASAYGWSVEQVEALDIDDAIGLLQEIELDDQFEKEWEHGLSEIAYPYDQSSKKQKFVPLKRPRWMNKMPDVAKLVRKIPKKMIPVGLVIKANEDKTSDNQ